MKKERLTICKKTVIKGKRNPVSFPAAFFPFFAALVFLAAALQARGQEPGTRFDVSASIDWIRGELSAETSFNLAQAGIKLPSGRLTGEELLNNSYPELLRPSLFSINVDSSSTVRSLVDRGELSLEELDALCTDASKIPPSVSSDLLRMTGRYTVTLGNIGSFLNRRRTAASPAKPLIPVPTAEYTGIIIIANNELPVHGRKTQALTTPCLFPKIWDTGMNLVYDRTMFNGGGRLMVTYTVEQSIFRPTPSGLDGELADLAGPNPLRIIAREVFGVNATDPVIDSEDALKILSTENNRRLLMEGRVVLVLSEETLKTTLRP